MLTASFRAPLRKPLETGKEAKRDHLLVHDFFFSPFTLLSQFSYCLIILQRQPQKMALTVFLLTYLFLTAKRVSSNFCPGKPLSSQRESNPSITPSHSLLHPLPEDSVQMQCSSRFNHRAPLSFMTGMTWEKNEEGRRRKDLISQ